MSLEPVAPPLENAIAALREAQREQAYWTANERRLTADYPDQFVAVLNGRIVATAGTLEDLYTKLRDGNIEPRRAWLRFLSATPRQLIL